MAGVGGATDGREEATTLLMLFISSLTLITALTFPLGAAASFLHVLLVLLGSIFNTAHSHNKKKKVSR